MIPARTAAASLVLGLGLGFAALAGDLSPAPGPIAPTHKTLTQVEPRIALAQENTPGDAYSVFRITAPGSYYLTADLQVTTPNGMGIEVASADVTIDLNGFAVSGGASTYGVFYDPSEGDPPVRLRVRNGRVTVGNYGVTAGPGSVLEDLFVHDCAGGLSVGSNGVIRNCVAYRAQISLGLGAKAERCFSGYAEDSSNGFSCLSGSSVVDCYAVGNGGDGIRVFLAEDVRIERCFVVGNNSDGISVQGGSGCTIIGNVAKGNSIDNYYITGAGHHVGAIVSDPALAGPWDNLSN